jgi:hypothetical protein
MANHRFKIEMFDGLSLWSVASFSRRSVSPISTMISASKSCLVGSIEPLDSKHGAVFRDNHSLASQWLQGFLSIGDIKTRVSVLECGSDLPLFHSIVDR